MPNPFNYGNPVSPNQMVGRWDQIETIAHDLLNLGGHSHMVIGGRRFGKSSFLEALKYFLVSQIDQTKPGAWYFIPVLVNLQSLIKHSPEGVFGLFLNTLHMYFDPLYDQRTLGLHFNLGLEKTRLHSYAQGRRRECHLDEFSEIADDFFNVFGNSSYKNLRLIFLIDEIEVGLSKDWTETLFSQLRSLINGGLLRDFIRFVIAGTSQVIDIRENGSPLLNMLDVSFLEALREKDILKIINLANNVPVDVTKAVLELCGGHPFIAQYLMHHLWEDGASKATEAIVARLANKFISEHYADLRKWRLDIGTAGQLAYRVLAEANTWLTVTQMRQLMNAPDVDIQRWLIALCYHGLAIRDDNWSSYHVSGELFKGWFKGTVPQSSTSPIKAPVGASSSIETPKPLHTIAFISYSHKDKKYLQELRVHLAHYIRTENLDIQTEALDVWDDNKIPPGAKWREEIEKALQSAKVAVLLISPDFLASDFIVNNELPPLLVAAKQEGATVLPVILRTCAFRDTELAQFQSVNAPSNPLSRMTLGKRDAMWTKVTELIREGLKTQK